MDNAEVIAKIDKALDTVAKLCEGEMRWTMRVPAEPERDPDLVIAGALQAAKEQLTALVAAQEPTLWRFTGIAGLKKVMTDAQYQMQTAGVRKWYEPMRAKCPQAQTAPTQGERQPGICPKCKEHALVFGHCSWCGHSCAK